MDYIGPHSTILQRGGRGEGGGGRGRRGEVGGETVFILTDAVSLLVHSVCVRHSRPPVVVVYVLKMYVCTKHTVSWHNVQHYCIAIHALCVQQAVWTV